MKLFRLIAGFLMSGCIIANAQVLSVNSGFDSDSIMIGEQIVYTLSVESEEDVTVVLPEFSDTLSRSIEILGSLQSDTSFNGRNRTISRKYLVTSFDPGWNTVPPLPVAFRKGEVIDTLFTTVDLLTVLSPEVDTTQAIMPIKGPVNTPLSFAEILPWLLISILGGGILVFLVIYLRKKLRKNRNPEGTIPRAIEAAHLVALRELEELKSEKLTQINRLKEHYTRLAEIVRVYIARQFGIHAMESTTGEIMQAFESQFRTDRELILMLDNLLNLADLVKFAKEDPGPQENDMHMDNAVSFVKRTAEMFEDLRQEVEEASPEQTIQFAVESSKTGGSNG